MKRIYFYFIYFLFFSSFTQAQKDSLNVFQPQFKFSANYNSTLNYYGRTDSLKSSGYFPMAEIWLHQYFYLSAAPVFISNTSTALNYAGTVITAGYQKITPHHLTNLYLVKPLYKNDVKLVQSALKVQAGASFGFLNKVLNLQLGADLKFSDQVDAGLSFQADHALRFQNKNLFLIDPTIAVYAGTQNFSEHYIRKTQGFLFFPGGSQQVNEQVKQFNVLAFEASIPLIFATGKMQYILSPACNLPQNLVSGQSADKSLLYLTASIKYNL